MGKISISAFAVGDLVRMNKTVEKWCIKAGDIYPIIQIEGDDIRIGNLKGERTSGIIWPSSFEGDIPFATLLPVDVVEDVSYDPTDIL